MRTILTSKGFVKSVVSYGQSLVPRHLDKRRSLCTYTVSFFKQLLHIIMYTYCIVLEVVTLCTHTVFLKQFIMYTFFKQLPLIIVTSHHYVHILFLPSTQQRLALFRNWYAKRESIMQSGANKYLPVHESVYEVHVNKATPTMRKCYGAAVGVLWFTRLDVVTCQPCNFVTSRFVSLLLSLAIAFEQQKLSRCKDIQKLQRSLERARGKQSVTVSRKPSFTSKIWQIQIQ